MIQVKARNAYDSKEDLKDNGFSWNKENKTWDKEFASIEEYNQFMEKFMNVTYYGRKVVNRYHSQVKFEVIEVVEEVEETVTEETTTEEVVAFVESNDFAYVYGAGLMFANDTKTRQSISDIAKQAEYIIKICDLQGEGCGCDELADELNNGCEIYKIYKNNQQPLYLAYYK